MENTPENIPQTVENIEIPETATEPQTILEHTQIAAIQAVETPKKEQYFMSELLLTAGPRKNFSQFASEGDVDLGEDVAGLLTLRDKTFFWVLDGTSDSAELRLDGKEIFSSRLFAQAIAIQLKTTVLDAVSPVDWIKAAIATVKDAWTKQFTDFTDAQRAEIAKNYKTTTFDVSTTLIAGWIDLAGHLAAARIGDSKLLSFDNTHQFVNSDLSEKPKRELYTRQFARLVFHPQKVDFSMSENFDKIEAIDLENIQTLFVFSDGVGSLTETYIKMNHPRIPDGIRENLVKMPQRTCDDKTFLQIQICSLAYK